MESAANNSDFKLKLGRILSKEVPIPPKISDKRPGKPPIQLRSFSTARSETSSQCLVLLYFGLQVGKVWTIDHTTALRSKNQVILVVTDSQLKIVQQQLVTHTVPLSAIVGVSSIPPKTSPDGLPVFGFKLCYTDRQPRHLPAYGVYEKTDRDLWMKKLLEELVPAQKSSLDYVSLHKCNLTATSTWTEAWVMVTDSRRLVFYDKSGVVADVDLRKMRSLDWDTGHLVLNHPNQILRIQILDQKFDWRQSVLNLATFASSQCLEHQKLNANNVPVIVAKCLDYIFMHGATSEGIYRKSGVTSKVTKLLQEFARNAF
jgi:RhoGAP domain